jgi:hypothetical protein
MSRAVRRKRNRASIVVRKRKNGVGVGFLLIIIGLIPVGVLADYLIENHVAAAPAESFLLFKRSFEYSRPELVAAGFVLGVVCVLFIMLGIGLLRGSWGKRRNLKQQIVDLQAENTKLHAREHLSDELRWASDESAEA